MKLPLILGLLLLAGAGALLCGPVISSDGFPLIIPAAWLGILGIVLVIGSLFERRFYKEILAAPPLGFAATAECFIDARTGQTVRIYFQAGTGERAYVRDAATG